MQLIDTHTHIYLPEFDADRDEAVERAVESGVIKLVMPNIDAGSIEHMYSAEYRYPGICFPMIGLHPTSVKQDYADQLEVILKESETHRFYAVGEIGIDLYWNKTFIKEQLYVFRRQVEFALEKRLPVVVHSRNSFPEVFEVLDEFSGKGLKGVLHAFSGTADDAEKGIRMGFRLGIGGIVTFKNSRGLDSIVKQSGPENIVLETDSPYLAPVPYRGKRNESSYLCIINRRLSEIFGIGEEEMARITYNNSVELFGV
jgi:TatD DNase family protein